MKLLAKYLYKKTITYVIVILAVLGILVVSSQMIHLPSVVYHLDFIDFAKSLILVNFSFFKLQFMFAVSLAFLFVGVNLKESREVYAIYALGVRKDFLFKVVLSLSIVFVILSIFFSFYLVPNANRERAKFLTVSVKRHFLEALKPKNFETIPGDTVIYMLDRKDKVMKDVLLFNKSDGKLITAQEAYFDKDKLVLKNGIIQIPLEEGFSLLKYKKYVFDLEVKYKKDISFDSYETKELLNIVKQGGKEKRKAISVITERIGYIIPFIFLGIMSFFMGLNIKKEKEFVLAIALLILIVFLVINFNILKLIEKGKFSPYLYFVVIFSYFAFFSYYFYRKSD